MSSQTTNLNLTLPTGTEGWRRSVLNDNFTILDTKIGAVGDTPLQTQINTLNSNLAQSYYDMKDTSTNAIGLIRFAGNKIAILSFTNQSGQIPSSGLQLPYTFKDDISTLCQYYNGAANDYGQLILSKTGLVQIRKSGQFVNATYVLGQITACLS